MPHVDEGTLHALLDGELAAAEVLEVQTHFATCPACAARLDEARQLLAETERLVSALEAPAARAAPSTPRLATSRPMIPLDPVVLIPDNPTATEVRRSRSRIMVWAAGFFILVGAGFYGLQIREGLTGTKRVVALKVRPEEFSTARPGVVDSIAARAASPVAPPPGTPQGGLAPGTSPSPFSVVRPSAPPPSPPAETKTTPVLKSDSLAKPSGQVATMRPSGPPPQQKPAATPTTSARQTPPPKRVDQAGPDDSAPDESAELAAGAARDRNPAAAQAAKATDDLNREALRTRAAQATAALDRERARDRAAAATAALDSARRAAVDSARRAMADSIRRAAAQRAQPDRIGLDEAARQLGGPLHAIDGMTRQQITLVSGQLIPGADTTRPVVRSVYVDRNGKTIYLDQQRVRPGQTNIPFTPQAGPNGQQMWMAGSVLLVLQGDLTPDSLRALSRRVR